MAVLFNINDLFAIDSSGAMEISGGAGAATYVLMSNGAGNANSWYDVQSKFGEYLPLTGGTLTGNLAINGTNSLSVGGVTTLNDLDVTDTLAWRVSPTDVARQRADARDDATNFARLHWFGKSDNASTSNFRHAYYDGANYINVTAASGAVTFDGILAATGGNSTEWNTSYDNSITALAVTGTTTKTLTATQQDGGTLTASWTDNDNNTSWPNVGAGIRTNYTLGFKPPTNNYAGFYFQTSDAASAGYLLIRGESGSGAYTSQGISLIADAGWLSLVSRTTTDKGVRIMAGATATTRLKIVSAGDITFNEAYTFPTSDGTANQVLKTDGSGNLDWATDNNTGTVTSVATGNGLTGGTITSSGTLTMASSYTGAFTFSTSVASPIHSGTISTTGDGQNNYPFRLGSDYSAYMVAAASNTWGLFWAGNSGARYGTNGLGGPGNIWSNSTNPNEFCFVGGDSTRWTVWGNSGDTWQEGNIYLGGTFIRANNNLTLQVDGAGTPVNAITIDNVGSTTFSGYTYFPNYLFHEGDTNTRIQFTTGTITLRGDTSIVLDGPTTTNANFIGTTATFSGLVSGITPTAAANFATKAYVDAHPGDNTAWANVGAGTRTNYTLNFKPPSNNYAGFQFLDSAGAGAGYLLIRGASNAGTVYKAEGISLISDASWITIASRTTTDAGVRLMSGSTSAERLVCKDNGESYFPGALGIGTTDLAAAAKLTVIGNQTFGLPGNGSNTSGRFISIEGNTDTSGEGSSRIFFTEHNSTTAAMDNYGMSLGYRGGATSIVGASGNTWTGLTQIGNGQWGMWGHNNNATGSLVMFGDRAATYVSIPSKLRVGATTVPAYTLDVTGSIYCTASYIRASTSPDVWYSNNNTDTYTQTVLYMAQNNTSNNDANGYFLERGRISNSSTAEIRRWVIGARGGQKQMVLDGPGTLTVAGDIIAYGTPSDKRLKENVKPIESALDKAMKLQGVTFNWKKSDSILDIKEDIGFIAQDVQKVAPELVRENEDGMLSMRHQGIAPILLEAIKELEARVKELENK